MNRHAPDALLLDAAKVVELAERIDQKKRDRLLFRLAREVIRADEVIAHMGYQIMMLENHLKSARASAEYWEGRAVTYTLQPNAAPQGRSTPGPTVDRAPLDPADAAPIDSTVKPSAWD